MQLLPRAECITMAAKPQSYSHSSEPEPGLILQPLRAGDVTHHSLQHRCPSQTRVSATILFPGNSPESVFWANLQQQASQLPYGINNFMPVLQGITPFFLLHCHESSRTTSESCRVSGPTGSTAACTAGSAHKRCFSKRHSQYLYHAVPLKGPKSLLNSLKLKRPKAI